MHLAKFLISLIDLKSIILFALILILCKCIIYHYSRNPQWVKFANEVPGPRIYPIIGNAIHALYAAKVYPGGAGKCLVNCANKYGPIFRCWLGPHLFAVISDLDAVEKILKSSNSLEKNFFAEHVNMIVGNALIVAAPAAIWKYKRRNLRPFFTKTAVLGRFPEMIEVTEKFVEKMRKEVDGPEFDIEHYMSGMSLDTIIKTHYNHDLSDEERNQVLDKVHRFNTDCISLIGIKWYFRPSMLQAILKWVLRADIDEYNRTYERFTKKIFNSIPIFPNWSEEKDESATKTINRENFVQSYNNTIYRWKNELNEANLLHFETTLMFAAATDTTGHTMAFFFLTLAALPDIQEKVYQEIYVVFGDDNRPVEPSDLNKFPYLKQVIQETQRLFTIIPVIERSIGKDMRIGAHIYPAGLEIIVNIGGIHHNPQIYPDPYRFNPENFTPEAIKKRHPCSFLPFSAGPRNCIGKEYAEINMLLRVIYLLRTFTFHTKVKFEDIKLQTGLLETSTIGYPVSVKLRRKVS